MNTSIINENFQLQSSNEKQAEFVNQQYHDLILYSMLSDEWQK